MPVLVTSNFDDDLIKNEWVSMETPFSHYKSMGNFLDAQRDYSNTNVHLVDSNVFAKFDEIPSLPVQGINEKKK